MADNKIAPAVGSRWRVVERRGCFMPGMIITVRAPHVSYGQTEPDGMWTESPASWAGLETFLDGSFVPADPTPALNADEVARLRDKLLSPGRNGHIDLDSEPPAAKWKEGDRVVMHGSVLVDCPIAPNQTVGVAWYNGGTFHVRTTALRPEAAPAAPGGNWWENPKAFDKFVKATGWVSPEEHAVKAQMEQLRSRNSGQNEYHLRMENGDLLGNLELAEQAYRGKGARARQSYAPSRSADQGSQGGAGPAAAAGGAVLMGDPIPMLLHCPLCGERHIDRGDFATKVHHTHACQGCGHVWRPAIVPTVGVQFLPGFKDEDQP